MSTPPKASAVEERPRTWILVAGWLVPGAAHVLLGQTVKGLVLFGCLIAMFAIGIGCGGRVFPFLLADPLVFLAAAAEWLTGLPRVVSALGGYGQGEVAVATYEYGNTFLIVAGLLNALALLDAFDVMAGRKGR